MSRTSNRVLIVTEELSVQFLLQRTLEPLGFDLEVAPTTAAALACLPSLDYEVVLLALPAPRSENVTACREIRKRYPRLPLLVLGDRNSFADKVEALEAGADDYVVQPLEERALRARLRAAIRRYRVHVAGSTERLMIGDLTLDITRHRVVKSGTEVALTPLECRALHVLMEQAGKPITHTTLLAILWGAEFTQHREYLRVLICGLRKKLEDNPAQPVYLLTHSHFGYLFRGARPQGQVAAV
jgi:two-component system, OmpR family, KDP operon response regulator KdpE